MQRMLFEYQVTLERTCCAGTLPESWNRLANLQDLRLANNSITGMTNQGVEACTSCPGKALRCIAYAVRILRLQWLLRYIASKLGEPECQHS